MDGRNERCVEGVALMAGFAVGDITPDRSATLMGYGFRAPGNDGVRDPLKVRACAMRAGETLAILVTCDIAVLPTRAAAALRGAIANAEGIAEANVIVAATHTHSGPEPTDSVIEALRPTVLDTVHRAAGLMFSCTVWHREAAIEFGYNRRVPTGDGIRHCWGPQEWPDRAPQGMPDTAFSVLTLRQKNGPRRYMLWGTGVHPVVLGRTSRVVSADYPGEACRLIESYEPGSRAMFLLGGAANVHPWVATQENPVAVEAVARAAASFAWLLDQAAQPVPQTEGSDALVCASRIVELGDLRVPVTLWRIGIAWLVAVPVELFSELAVVCRRRLPGPVLMATLANGWLQYWPTQVAAQEGGYEAECAPDGFVPGMGEQLVDAIVELAQGM